MFIFHLLISYIVLAMIYFIFEFHILFIFHLLISYIVFIYIVYISPFNFIYWPRCDIDNDSDKK